MRWQLWIASIICHPSVGVALDLADLDPQEDASRMPLRRERVVSEDVVDFFAALAV